MCVADSLPDFRVDLDFSLVHGFCLGGTRNHRPGDGGQDKVWCPVCVLVVGGFSATGMQCPV